MPRTLNAGVRLLLGVAGAALVVFGLWLSAIAVIVGIDPVSPNPFIASGDPCCGYPDTWGEVRAGAFWGWVWLGAALLAAVAGLMLVVGGTRGRLLRWRWLAIGVLALWGFAAISIVQKYLSLDEAPQVVYCREARGRTATYRSESLAERQRLAQQITECRLISGRTRTQVRALLGEPERVRRADGPVDLERWHYGYGLLEIRFSQYPSAAEPVVSFVSRDT